MASATERYAELLKWADQSSSNSGSGSDSNMSYKSLHPAVEIYYDETTKASFRVKDSSNTEVGAVIVTLPLSKSLSYLNAISRHADFASTSLPDIAPPEEYFPAQFLKETAPHVIGRFFLMQQYLRGPASPWWPYIRTLPQPQQMTSMLPLMWPSDDLEFLMGTNAFVAVEEIRSTLKKEHKRAMKLLPERYKFEYTRPLYYWAYCIFTSRSFRPSLILPSEETMSLPCAMDDFSVLLPLFDIGNHSPFAKTSWVLDESARACKLQVGQAYSAGEQVFNNYGKKTNAELLLGYGFTFPPSDQFHNDYVHVKTKANPEAGDLAATHLISLWPLAHPSSMVGQSRLLQPDLPTCLPCFAHIQDSLIAALYESITKGNDEGIEASLVDIMQGNIPEALLGAIVNALGSKLSMDLEELEQTDPDEEACNQNQEMALQYRRQCKQVLENALMSLSTVKA
ncbi:hypothetical protein F4780DRAFT_169546 [Xylariomycetidae sp. FL0641]|nr:hypothetical protein F4780DRAFT_169546 [Xylariomycetidae sp. FL0641]